MPSPVDVTIKLLGQHGKRMIVYCRVLVNMHETTEEMLGQEVLRVACYDISLCNGCLYSRQYASIGSYHEAAISFLKGDTAIRAAGCTMLSARSATMVSLNTGLEVQSTVDSLT